MEFEKLRYGRMKLMIRFQVVTEIDSTVTLEDSIKLLRAFQNVKRSSPH